MDKNLITVGLVAASLFIASGASAECRYAEKTFPDGGSHPDNPCIVCYGDEIRELPARSRCGPELWCDGQSVWASECVPGMFAGVAHTVCESVTKAETCPGEQKCNNDVGYCVTLCESDADCSGDRTCDALGSCVSPTSPVQPPPPDADMGGGMGPDDVSGEPDMNDVQKPDGGPGGVADMGPGVGPDTGPDLDSGGDSAAKDEDDRGCSVASGRGFPAALLLFFGFVIGFRRRRS